MDQQKILLKTERYVKETLGEANNGRDWWHVYRVWQMARHICTYESSADLFIVEIASLLHDMAHWQLTDGDENHGPYTVEKFLTSLGVDQKTIAHVLSIIRDTKFKGATNRPHLKSIESKIVYDADKLDSLGAIGIAKTFTYGGATHRPIHSPTLKPTLHQNSEAYRQGDTTSINHFYEKNLLLKDWMQTKVGETIAKQRHTFLQEYLKEFYKEWEGKS